MSDLIQNIKAARRVSTPIISVSTPDPGVTQKAICEAINGNAETPKIAWDVVRGLYARNDDGLRVIAEMGGEQLVEDTKANPVKALVVAEDFPPRTVLFFHNAQRFMDEITVIQAIWNLRDCFKQDRRTLILLGPELELPAELTTDIVEFDEPLPTDEQLAGIVREQLETVREQAEFEITDELIGNTATALKGTSAFAAEQLTAMSLRTSGVDRDYLDTQAKKLIEQTPGLTFERGTETFDQIGGMDFIKSFGTRFFAGPKRPAVVVRIEELEKAMSGAKGDLSGTSGDALQVILSEMEDNDWSGILAYGAPGAGKSLFAKSLANSHGAKAVRFDVNATKGSLVGQSEQRIRAAMKVIRTIGGRRVFFLASVNKLDSLPPELQRRFRCGVWFFDIPSEAERKQIWEINLARFGLEAGNAKICKQRDLTGADIRNICEMADSLQCSLDEATHYVVPLKTQSPNAIEDARKMAHGKFIDAGKGGVYETPGSQRAKASRNSRRSINMKD